MPLNLPKSKCSSLLRETLTTLHAIGIQPEMRAAKGSHVLVTWHDGTGIRRAICIPRDVGDQSKVYRAKLRRILRGHSA
jgi:hypothetical protein